MKLLTAIAVFVLAIAAFGIITVNDVDAESTEAKTVTGEEFLALDIYKDGVITLDQNYYLSSKVLVTDNLKIVLNGYTIEAAGSAFVLEGVIKDGKYTGEKTLDKSVTLEIDGKVAGSSIVAKNYVVANWYNQDCILIVNGGTYTGGNWAFLWYNYKTNEGLSTASFEEATINASGSGLWISNDTHKSLTVKGCTITANDIGIYAGTVKKTVIEDTTVTVKTGTCIEIKCGSAEIKGNTVLSGSEYVAGKNIYNSGSGGAVATIFINNAYNAYNKTEGSENPMEITIADSVVMTPASGNIKIAIGTADDHAKITLNASAIESQEITVERYNKAGTSGISASVLTTLLFYFNSTDAAAVQNYNELKTVTSPTKVMLIRDVEIGETIDKSTFDIYLGSNELTVKGADAAVSTTIYGAPSDDKTANYAVLNAFKAGAKGVTFSSGSIVLEGGEEIASGAGIITINGKATVIGNVVVNNIVIANGATLEVPAESSLTITKAADIQGNGKLVAKEDSALTIAEEAIVTLGANAEMKVDGKMDNGGTIASTSLNTDSDYVYAASTDGSSWTYFTEGSKVDMLANGYLAVVAGSLVPENGITVFTDSRFILTYKEDSIVWMEGEEEEGDEMSVIFSADYLVIGDNLFKASVKIDLIGGTVGIENCAEFNSVDIAYDVLLNKEAGIVVPVGSTINFLANGSIEDLNDDAKIFIYGNITSYGVANPENCIATEVVLPGASPEKVNAIKEFYPEAESTDVIASTVNEAIIALESVDIIILNAGVSIDADLTIGDGKKIILSDTVTIGNADEAVTIDGPGTIKGSVIVLKNAVINGTVITGNIDVGNGIVIIETEKDKVSSVSISVDDENKIVSLSGSFDDVTITIDSEYTLLVGTGSTFTNAEITIDDATITFKKITSTKGNLKLSGGSVALDGDIEIDGDVNGDELTFNNVTLVGTGIITVDKLTITGTVTIPAGVEIVLEEGKKIIIGSDAKITGAGKITIKDASGLEIETGAQIANGIIDPAEGVNSTTVDNQAEMIAKYNIYNTFIINADGFELTDSVTEALTIGKKTIVLNGHDLTIAGEVIFDETTVIGDDRSKVIVNTGNAASLTLNKANVYATVEDEDENITIKSALVSGWDTDSADTIKVGYGNTLNMKSVNIVSGKVITVYGILNIEGTTTVNPGASVVIKDGAVANNSGTLTILGKELNGSVVVEGTLNNTGSIVVGDNNGYATMTVSGKVFLKDGSSLNVKVAKSADKLDDNYLAGTGAVTVDAGATLTVNGTISVASVYLKGTLGMNGTAAGTTVYLYDGVSVAVTSVTGTISFSDKYVVDEDALKDDGVTQKENVIYSDGNQITLTNVKGVVVSESVKAGSVKIDEDNYKTYVCGLTISGVVSAIKDTNGSIVIDRSADLHGLGIPSVSSYVTPGKVTVGDMALGKKVTLSTNGKVTVSGNLTAVEEDSAIIIGNASKDMVTVTGLITCLDFELDGNLSAAMYSIHDTEKATETYYYTTFVAAVDAAPAAYENTVVLYGKITVSEGITIAKPIVIELDSSAKVTIKGTADIVIDNGAKLDGSAGEITVTGTLKVVDKDSGIVEPVKEKFNYEVLLTDDADKQVVIYAGLVGVLKNAEAGQTVTMQKSATISEDIEIKEGVTLVVPEKLTLFIGSDKNDVTLTVNGTIQVEKRAYIKPTQQDNMEVTIVVNGVISSYDEAEFSDFVSAVGSDSGVSVEKFTMTDFAYFNIDQKVYYWSNLTYAAENCHEGEIEVTGQLTAGDIVFTEDEKATEELVVKVVTPEGAKVNTNVYATSITLDGATLMVDQKSKISTTVKGSSLSGDASVILDGVSLFGIGSVYDEVKEENHLYIAGAPTGTITIAAGNVEVADAFAVYAAEDRSVEFTVADGATLTVPKDAEFASANAEDSDVLIVEGTLAVKNGGEAYIVSMYLAGTMTVESKVVYIADSTIAGTLDVKEKTETTEEGLVSLDMVFVGDEPKSLGANGTVIGNIKVDNGDWFYVFNGSDVSKAKINYNLAEQKNDIKTTVVNINGDDVVTIYAYGSVDVYDALDAAEIELIGLETPAFDSTTKMYSAPTLKTEDLISDAANVKVGKYTNVYLDFALVGIHGMISQGQGVILMIDGNTIDNYRATLLGGDYVLSVGTYKVTYEPAYGYEDKGIKITFNGSVVTDGKITITADMKTFSLTVSDATPADPVTPITPVDPSQPEKDDSMGITEYLLIVLVILAAILVVVVAIRMMRS